MSIYRRWSSQYVLPEERLGTIEPQKAADFLVLTGDYLTLPEHHIGKIDPALTVMGGKVTYSEPRFATSQGLPQVGDRGDGSYWWRGPPRDLGRRSNE